MNLALLLTLLDAVPGIINAGMEIRSDLSVTDQAALDVKLDAAKAAALEAVAKADAALDEAAKK